MRQIRKGKKRCGWVTAIVVALGAAVASAQVPYSQQSKGTIDAAAESVTLDARGLGSLAVDIRGTFSATFEAQCTVDGTNWEAIRMTPPDTTTSVTSTTTAGIWTGSTIAGCLYVRVYPTSWTSGSAAVVLRGIQGGGGGTGGGGGGGDATETTLQDVATATEAIAAGMTGTTLGVDVKFINGGTPYTDPCSGEARTQYVVNLSTAGTTEIANSVASEFFYICSLNVVNTGAQTIAFAEDDTDGCGSPSAGLIGGTSAATGWALAANSGVVLQATGYWHLKTTTAARYLCVLIGQSTQTSGTLTYVSAP